MLLKALQVGQSVFCIAFSELFLLLEARSVDYVLRTQHRGASPNLLGRGIVLGPA